VFLEVRGAVARRLSAADSVEELDAVILHAIRTVVWKPFVDDAIADQITNIETIFSRKADDTLPLPSLEEAREAIHHSVCIRLWQVQERADIPRLVLYSARDERLWPYLRAAIDGSPGDFIVLWWRVYEPVMRVIRQTAGPYGDIAVTKAEDLTP